MLLVITNVADVHPNPVITKMTELGMPVFRLNTDRLIADYDVSYYIDQTGFHFHIKYKDYPYEISSEQISCVWERRPMKPITTYHSYDDKQLRDLVIDEADGFFEFFRRSLVGIDLLWIGHPIKERFARSKIMQKIVASKLGMRFPKTLFSNKVSDIDIFGDAPIALKPISVDNIQMDQDFLVFYTTKLHATNLKELGNESFCSTINYIEEYTEKQYELRVTVVNGEFFTAKVCSQELSENTGSIDWRQGYDHGIKFVAIPTPDEIISFCTEFLKYFDLRFGCFDFILNKEGEYIFLECNTNGQWLWLERDAGLPISDAFVRTFISAYEMHAKNRGQHSIT